jgi:hypothetical protein
MCGVLLFPTFANAACTLAEMAGNWQAYMLRYNGPFDSWAQCKLTISSTGKINNTTCKVMPVATHSFTAGSVKLGVGALCMFTAKFTINGVVHTVQHATLGRDKNFLSGVGQTTAQSLLFHMVRL